MLYGFKPRHVCGYLNDVMLAVYSSYICALHVLIVDTDTSFPQIHVLATDDGTTQHDHDSNIGF